VSDNSALRICPWWTYGRWLVAPIIGPLDRIVWITGASSGIGAALAATAPADTRVIGIARRLSACAESIQADLSDPGEWPGVNARIRETLTRERPARAVLMHFAGAGAPIGAARTVDPVTYARAAMLNGVSGSVLGAAFLRSCGEIGSGASIVMCSSPAATSPRSGLSQYCAGKAALEQWVRAVAVEEATRDDGAYVFAVVPYAVDTPMVRELIEADDAVVPLAAHFRDAARADRLADPELTAYEIWQLLDAGDRHGEAVAVGATPVSRRPHHLNLASDGDVSRTAEFYRDLLDLKPVELPRDADAYGADIYTFEDNAGYQYHFVPAEHDFAERQDIPVNPLVGHLAFRVDDLGTVRDRLDAAGVAYSDMGIWAIRGWHQLFCADPDGRVIEFHQVVSGNSD